MQKKEKKLKMKNEKHKIIYISSLFNLRTLPHFLKSNFYILAIYLRARSFRLRYLTIKKTIILTIIKILSNRLSKNYRHALSQKKIDWLRISTSQNVLAEREGFEPPVPLSTSVFKTDAIDHSAISPK